MNDNNVNDNNVKAKSECAGSINDTAYSLLLELYHSYSNSSLEIYAENSTGNELTNFIPIEACRSILSILGIERQLDLRTAVLYNINEKFPHIYLNCITWRKLIDIVLVDIKELRLLLSNLKSAINSPLQKLKIQSSGVYPLRDDVLGIKTKYDVFIGLLHDGYTNIYYKINDTYVLSIVCVNIYGRVPDNEDYLSVLIADDNIFKIGTPNSFIYKDIRAGYLYDMLIADPKVTDVHMVHIK